MQALHDKPLGGAVGIGDQVELALQFVTNATLEIGRQECAGLACNIDSCFEVRGRVLIPLSGILCRAYR